MTATQAPVQREPRKCDLPNCPVVFVPKTGRHIFHSTTCKKRAFRYQYALGRK